jgi:nitroreductase
MTTIDELLARKSVRVFEDKPVSEEVRSQVLAAAFAAPTAGNMQLYSILQIESQELKDKLAVSCDNQPFIAAAPWVLIFLADMRRWLDCYAAAGVATRPVGPGDLMLACQDAIIAAQNAVVAAHSLGLGSCYIGDIVEQVEDVRSWLSLDEYVYPATMLVFGYPTVQQLERKKPVRFAPQFLVHTDRYARLTKPQIEALFESRGQDLSFAARTAKRKFNTAFAEEMNRSTRTYLDPFLG